MRLNEEQKRILAGEKGKILQSAMVDLVKYGTAMGAEEFIPISSAHTSFLPMAKTAMCFPPRGVQLTKEDVDRFSEEMTGLRVNVKTTINPGVIDIEKWREIGADEGTYHAVMRAGEIARKCGILPTYSCTPYISENIPIMGESCAWAETSACLYINSFLGARSNRESFETSLYSALLGITPNFGMHLDENRKGTHLIDVQCEIRSKSDWGALGYFTGERVSLGIPVFNHLKRPTVEEAKQLATCINVPGSTTLFHIPGVTPEAATIEEAFGGNIPRETYIFGEAAKKETYRHLNYEPEGKVDMVFLGCPHATLYEIKEICDLLEGKHVAGETALWVMTSHATRAAAYRAGYGQIIEDSGGKLFADGCLGMYYLYYPLKRPVLKRVATNAAKQAFTVRRSFGSKVFFGNEKRCIEIAVAGCA
ncbi:MAG: aconitase X catalytic domain-containing protein [Deltaproteobacteria bacterium]|nr:aconitase X catalytic domain-containing protein [Deltaproteobacteria bacterium]